MRVIDTDFSDTLSKKMSRKTCKNILIYDILCRTFMSAKPFGIWFEKIYGFIKIHNGISYLVLFGPKRCDAIYDRIRYLISKKRVINDIISNNFQESELIHRNHYL